MIYHYSSDFGVTQWLDEVQASGYDKLIPPGAFEGVHFKNHYTKIKIYLTVYVNTLDSYSVRLITL